jgi:hypothetical protein
MPRKETKKTEETATNSQGQRLQPPQNMSNGNGGSQHDNGISPEAVAARAYDIYEREGRIDGRDMDHWIRAEAELRAENANRSAQGNVPGSPAAPRQQDVPRSMRQHQNERAVA